MDARTACLAVLARRDASGYEIKKAFEDGPYAQIQDVGFGSIYPALKKLLADGLVTVTDQPGTQRPGKRIFQITPAGRLVFMDRLGAAMAPDKVRSDFLFRLLFADLLSAGDIEQLIDQRVAELRAAVAEAEQCHDKEDGDMPPGAHFVCGFGLAIYRSMIDYLEEHKYQLVGAALLADEAAE